MDIYWVFMDLEKVYGRVDKTVMWNVLSAIQGRREVAKSIKVLLKLKYL